MRELVLTCDKGDWERRVDADNLDAAVQAGDEFNDHETEVHPAGAGFYVRVETDR